MVSPLPVFLGCCCLLQCIIYVYLYIPVFNFLFVCLDVVFVYLHAPLCVPPHGRVRAVLIQCKRMLKYNITCISVQTGFGFVNRFIDHLQVVTTNNYNTIADFHTTNYSTLSLLSLLSLVFTW
jgi:hypothetical protein